MVVRIRFEKGSRIAKIRGTNRRLASAAAALLILPTVMALVLAVWRITAARNWTSTFAITSGFFSHWEAWLAAAALLQLLSRMLGRYGRGTG
jgi:hypothetical protein